MPEPVSQSVCGLPFLPNEDGVLLSMYDPGNGYIYDGFGGPLCADPRKPNAGELSVRKYVLAATGIRTIARDWTEIVTLRGDGWEVGFYFCVAEAFCFAKQMDPTQMLSMEDPQVLPLNIVTSLRWLIPLALDQNVIKPLGLSAIQL